MFRAVTDAETEWDVCKRLAPRPTRPMVTVPSDLKFNYTLAVDFAQVAPVGLILQLVDLGSPFSRDVAIESKEAASAARAFLSGWSFHHGAPRAVLADPRAEFNNAVWGILSERHNIMTLSTAAQAHWSNNVVERYKMTLKSIFPAMLRENFNVSAQEVLDLAWHAKNSMGQYSGASPDQLLCGSTPRVRVAHPDALPALSYRRVAADEALYHLIDLLHAARDAHTEAEASSSLRRALARNAASVPVRNYEVGDAVYVWTEGVEVGRGGWQGPADITDVAVAKDNVSLQYGHQWDNPATSQVRLSRPPSVMPIGRPGPVSVSCSPTPPSPAPAASATDDATVTRSDASDEPADTNLAGPTASMLTGVQAALDCIAAESTVAPVDPPRAPTVWSGRTRGGPRHVNFAAAAFGPSSSFRPTPDQLLPLRQHKDEDFFLKRFGFRRGSVNRRFSDAKDLGARHLRGEDVLMAAFAGPDTLEAALRRTGVATHNAFVTRRELRQSSEVQIASAGAAFEATIMEELAAWAGLVVCTEVPEDGQVLLSTRWVLTLKEPDSPTSPPRRNARLVVRGFVDAERDSVDSTSPTASRATFRVMLSAMASQRFIPRTVDRRTVFLQDMPMDRPTPAYVQPLLHARVPAGMVWRLRKCAYGLTDAPLRWYDGVLKLMNKMKLQWSSRDHGLFNEHFIGVLQRVVAVHVDHFLFGGTAPAVARYESSLRQAYGTGPTKSGEFTFTGVQVRTTADDDSCSLTVREDQEQYVDSIDVIDIRRSLKALPDSHLLLEELTSDLRATSALL